VAAAARLCNGPILHAVASALLSGVAVGQTTWSATFCAFGTTSRFWGEPFRSRRNRSDRLGRFHEVGENGHCAVRTTGLVCPTATAKSMRGCRGQRTLPIGRRRSSAESSRNPPSKQADGCQVPLPARHDRLWSDQRSSKRVSFAAESVSTPGRTRTCDPRLRRPSSNGSRSPCLLGIGVTSRKPAAQ
jgi:hypothetical protein